VRTFTALVAIPFCGTVARISAKLPKKAGELLFEPRFDGRADIHRKPLLDLMQPGLTGQ
jgi:hypothetical protein